MHMYLETQLKKINNRSTRMGVIGLGYVGLPVAAMFAMVGYDVVGIDINQRRMDVINEGRSPIEGFEPGLDELVSAAVVSGRLRASADYELLRDRDVILIDVETPVDDQHIPRYGALKAALNSLARVLHTGSLVIVESTIAPGTMKELVCPLLENGSGLKVNVDFFLGNCPERVMPGRLLANLRSLSRVVGGGTPETAQTAAALYSQVVQADLDTVDWITAELVKTVENAYRDVQIAFANEVALICEAVGGDVWTVRDLVNKSPFRQMHLPGAGVGGHCIPKDPWLLAYGVRSMDILLRLIPAARAVNDGMPGHIFDLVVEALKQAGKMIKNSRILILGYAYLENSDDVRNSPSEVLAAALQFAGAEVIVHDPFVQEYKGDLYQRAEGCDAAVLMVRHNEYLEIDLSRLGGVMSYPIIIDGRRAFDPQAVRAAGIKYYLCGTDPLTQ
jgi:UDP-N-acetyl-D-mannosaminuronic acid dehydrogenase